MRVCIRAIERARARARGFAFPRAAVSNAGSINARQEKADIDLSRALPHPDGREVACRPFLPDINNRITGQRRNCYELPS